MKSLEEIEAEITMTKNRIKLTKSHLGRIELEKKLSELIEMKKHAKNKQSWEL